jgi:hypothetical protein
MMKNRHGLREMMKKNREGKERIDMDGEMKRQNRHGWRDDEEE